jgi:hypothetical protein
LPFADCNFRPSCSFNTVNSEGSREKFASLGIIVGHPVDRRRRQDHDIDDGRFFMENLEDVSETLLIFIRMRMAKSLSGMLSAP